MQKLARYWATDYDWRKCEAKLNALPRFVTTIIRRMHDVNDIYGSQQKGKVYGNQGSQQIP